MEMVALVLELVAVETAEAAGEEMEAVTPWEEAETEAEAVGVEAQMEGEGEAPPEAPMVEAAVEAATATAQMAVAHPHRMVAAPMAAESTSWRRPACSRTCTTSPCCY